MLLINGDGTLEIINIEVVDKTNFSKQTIPVSEESVFFKDKQKFTKAQVDNLKANSQAQVLANQGRDVVRAGTIYIHVLSFRYI